MTCQPPAHYDFPAAPGLVPMDNQRMRAAFLAGHKRAFELSEMRTGKTLTALWAADYIMHGYGDAKRALIVAPRSIMRLVWLAHVRDHLGGHRTGVVLEGDMAKRRKTLAMDHAGFVITNPDALKTPVGKDLFDMAKAGEFAVMIFDEATTYRHTRTKRWRTTFAVASQIEYVWLLTGTPTPQAPTDAYGLEALAFGPRGSFVQCKERLMVQIDQFKWAPRPGHEALVAKMLSPAVRVRQDECFAVQKAPPQNRAVELTSEQKKAFASLRAGGAVRVAGKTITAVHAAATRLKFMQISAGMIYDADHDIVKVNCASRLEALKEIAMEAPAKIIVFASFHGVLDVLEAEFGKDCVRVDGTVSDKHIEQRVNAFQSGEPRWLLAHPAVVARGHKFTCASTIVWFTPTDKSEEYQQANQRIFGPDQQANCSIINLVSCPLEANIFAARAGSEALQEQALSIIEGKGLEW